MNFCYPRYCKKAVINSANPRSMDICLSCLISLDFVHRIPDTPTHLSMSISTLRKAMAALILINYLFRNAGFFAADKAALDFLSDAYFMYARREKSKTTQSGAKRASSSLHAAAITQYYITHHFPSVAVGQYAQGVADFAVVNDFA